MELKSTHRGDIASERSTDCKIYTHTHIHTRYSQSARKMRKSLPVHDHVLYWLVIGIDERQF